MLPILDIVIIGLYLIGTIAIGIAARGRHKDSHDYFTAGGQMGGRFASILVGLSVAATLFSGISFLAYPSVMYDGGIVVFVGTALVGMPVAYLTLRWFLPRYLGAGVAHPYDTIERRFGASSRTTASVMYALMRIGWMAALIYAPTLAIMGATGLSQAWFWPCILTIGLVSTLYTVFGGIRGVIVTDAIQFLVIMIGVAATIGYAAYALPVSIDTAVGMLRTEGRLDIFPLSLNPTAALTVWTVVIGATVANLSNYIGDQMSLQRYLATGNSRSALRAFTINVLGVVAVLALLAGIGLILFAFYHYFPEKSRPSNVDEIFPHFIATQLPTGVSGLLLAAILAATMSSMTSGINALSATLTLDLLPRLGRPMTGQSQLQFAKLSSLVVGLISTGLAGFVHLLGTLFSLAQKILGVFAGPLLVVMLFSVLSLHVTSRAMVVGMVGGCLAGWAVALSPIAALWTAPSAAGVTAIVALTLSAVTPDPT